MNLSRFNVDAPTFSAELVVDACTHKVTRATPLLSWLVGLDRFSLFRLCAKRGWHLSQQLSQSHELPKLKEQVSDSFSADHAAAQPVEARESGSADSR